MKEKSGHVHFSWTMERKKGDDLRNWSEEKLDIEETWMHVTDNGYHSRGNTIDNMHCLLLITKD